MEVIDNNFYGPSFKPNPEALRFIPLGGIGEIGKNMFVYEFGGDIIVVDCGILFPEEDMFGIDLVLPDISFLLEHSDRVRGIILTHGHDDHIAALPWVLKSLNVPIWGTKLTLGLLRKKLLEHPDLDSVTLNEVDSDDMLHLGPFDISFFRVTHSIPDGVGLAISCPAGQVIHPGDFKFEHSPLHGHTTELQKLAIASAKGVLALMVDVTNVEDPGWVPSEQVVAKTLDDYISSASGRVIVTCYATNIARIQEIINASVRHGRKVCVIGRSMRSNMQVAMDLGYITLPEPDCLVDQKKVNRVAANQLVIIMTGSQGEPMSALCLLSASEHRDITLDPTDLVLMAGAPVPGNEERVSSTINRLCRLGAEVIYDSLSDLHVSGHGCQEDIKLMLAITSPNFSVPMHGEFRHLSRYRELVKTIGKSTESVKILHSGDVLELTENTADVVGHVQAGRILLDGIGIGDVNTHVLRDRKDLSEDGILMVLLVLDSQAQQITGEPFIVTRGFVYVKESKEMLAELRKVAINAMGNLPLENSSDIDLARSVVRSALKKFIYKRTKRRPMVIVEIVEV